MNQNLGLPIGYLEVQKSWITTEGEDAVALYNEALVEVKLQMLAERPDLKVLTTRLEYVRDGAGVEHTNLYVGFVPSTALSSPLDPHNMNSAPNPKIGGENVAPADWVGRKESKF